MCGLSRVGLIESVGGISNTMKMLTKKDVAERLGVKESTVLDYTQSKRLGCVHLTAKTIRFTPEQVEAFILGGSN